MKLKTQQFKKHIKKYGETTTITIRDYMRLNKQDLLKKLK